MKSQNKPAKKEEIQERLIEKVLKSNKKIFPETIEEVMAFEKMYGSTDITLPENLQHPTFLFTFKEIEGPTLDKRSVSAVAARNEGLEISSEIKQKMAEDRKKARTGIKKNKGK